MNEELWSQLADTQAGMLSQRELTELHVSRSYVRNQLRARRWVQRTSSVFSTTTGPLSWQQRLWQAVLHAGPTATIGGLTAAELHGMKNWSREDITVLVDDELSFDPLEGVHFFRSRRPLAEMRSARALPLCQLEPAVLLFAGYEPSRRTAHGAVTATVQQRLTTPDRLSHWLGRMTPLRRAPELRALLHDIAGWSSLAVGDRPASRLHKVRRRGTQRPEGPPGSKGPSSMDGCRVGSPGRVRARARG